MQVIERYIFRRATQATLITLCALAGALWVVQVLREIDVVTTMGQAIWIFLVITVLGLPGLLQFVAPLALLVGILATLNRLIDDSEIPVIAAAGASPKAVYRPILVLTALVTLAVAVSQHFLTPASLTAFKNILTRVRADVIATLVQDGGFHRLDDGLTLHFRERGPDGGFRDVFINDERSALESRTFAAARGLLLERDNHLFLVLQNGDLIRDGHDGRQESLVTFEAYALDLSQIGATDATPAYRAKERSTLFLLDPPPDDAIQGEPQRVQIEIHERMTAPLYTLVFAMVALGFLGRPRTSRQDHATAITTVVLICLIFRVGGFAAFTVGRTLDAAIPFLYIIPFTGLAFGIYVNLRDPRSWITPRVEAMRNATARAGRRMLGRSLTPAAEG